MDSEKSIDESWKESVAQEKEKGESVIPGSIDKGIKKETDKEDSTLEQELPEVTFLTYISSLMFQTMIFLGEIPNPLNNEVEKNLKQAKFLIDTLSLIKEKTTGNLTKEENELLSASLYELQMKYIQIVQKEGLS